MKNKIAIINKLKMEEVPFIEKDGSEYHHIDDSSYKFYYRKSDGRIMYKHFSTDKGGDLIQFVRDTTKYNFVQSVDYLYCGLGEELEMIVEKRKKEKPKKPEIDLTAPENEALYLKYSLEGLSHKEAVSLIKDTPLSSRFDYYIKSIESDSNDETIKYLVNERCINIHIVEYFISQGLIKTTTNGLTNISNSLFIYKNPKTGETSGLTERGTRSASYRFDERTNKYVKGRAFSRNYANTSYGFNIVKGSPKKLVILESPIDLLSYLTLFAGEEKLNDAIFMATGGTNRAIIDSLIDELDIKHVVVATDNDKAGELTYSYVLDKFNKECKVEREKSKLVDFNDDLKAIRK